MSNLCEAILWQKKMKKTTNLKLKYKELAKMLGVKKVLYVRDTIYGSYDVYIEVEEWTL